MNTNVINSAWGNLRARYRASPVRDFLAWWRDELSGMIPSAFRQRMVSPRPSIWLVLSENGKQVTLCRGGDEPEQLGELLLADDLQGLRRRWADAISHFEDGAPEIRLCLPADHVLACPVEQPLAVEANLGNALGYQLDQLTPFRATDVLFDYQTLERNTQSGRLKLDLRLVPRSKVTPLLDRLNSIGIMPHAIDSLSDDSDTLQSEGFNLIPEAQRPRYIYRRARLNWVLAGVALLVLGLVMAQSLYLRKEAVDTLRSEVDSLRMEADQVMALQRQLEDSLQAANFLAERRRRQPVVIQVLDEVSRVLPNDMWINQLQLRGNQMSLMGLADGSSRLIEIINASPLLDDAAFRGSINVDPATGKERFNAQASITRGGRQDATSTESRE